MKPNGVIVVPAPRWTNGLADRSRGARGISLSPHRLPDELIDAAQLPCLPGIDWALTVAQLFSWLKVGGS